MLIKNIGQLVTPVGNKARKGSQQGDVLIVENAAIGITDGKISYVGSEKDAPNDENIIDADGKLVTPGLVDCHTHLVFGGWRQHELSLKIEGMSYMDILKSGGGILSTVENTRKATEDELIIKTAAILENMLLHGTTTCEAKSGYGLTTEDEIKQLRVVKKLKESSKVMLVSTFLGAHAVPKEYEDNREAYIKLVCEEMIPLVAKEELAEFCDIFCESAVFTVAESRKILETAKQHGLGLKIHADEINSIGGSELAGEFFADSAEHLIQTSDSGIKALSKSGTIAVLLPSASFYLDKPFARARKMVEEGVAVAIASDFNPGSTPNFNLQFPMNLACLKYKLTPKEAITAVTLNAAAAIRRADHVGSIELGKQGDAIIWDCPDLNFLFYRYGNNQVKHVIKGGELV